MVLRLPRLLRLCLTCLALLALEGLCSPRAALAQDALTLPLPGPAGQDAQDAQDEEEPPALLVADSIVVTPDNELIAEGNVEMRYDGRVLRAARVIYNQESDSLRLEGPLRAEDSQGAVLVASAAEVDAGLRNGVLRGARLVLDRQLQLAAVQLARVEGRYSVLSRAAVTSCRICADGSAPLWEIRARRVVHDTLERQLYLDGAQLRVLDVPVGYIPKLRLPDPTLERARGFLFPSLRSTTKLGTGLKLPYFIPIGRHRDLTLTPYLSAETTTLEYRYRQAFARGDVQIDGAVTRDSLRSGQTRGYLFLEGAFDIGRDYDLSFDLELTSDEAYLRDYGYSGKSRLDSAAALTRVSRDRLTRAELIHYHTLRDDEDDATQPGVVLDGVHTTRHFPAMGGEVRLSARVHGHYRFSDDDVTGRDVYRASTEALWRESWLLGGGAKLALQTGLAVDAVRNLQDSTSAEQDASAAPFVAATLRYPLVASGALGTQYSLEPVAQLSWTGGDRLETANDESTRSELDEGNLLALSRFSTTDRRERGAALALGLRWGVIAPSGWRSTLSVGRVLREERQPDFSPSSGLSARNSDWLVAAEIGNATGLDLIARAMIDPETARINRGEARTRWSNAVVDLTATYLLLPEDAVEARSDVVSEWSFDGGYQVSRHWRASASWHYDIAQDRSSSGALGLEYQNECVVARFEADRDFADSDNLDPTTTFGLTVELKGFATGGDAGGYLRQCSN
jgi:LPS-assembly protein